MKNVIRLGLVAAFLVPAGCEDDGPPTVRYGQEGCAHCRMIVNDDRFAAALVTPAGDALKFDEVCCLVDYLAANPNAAKAEWVRGYRSGQWHDPRQALFVHGPRLQTPMGSGLAAVPTREQADALAAELNGRVLRYDELPAFLKDQQAAAAKAAPGGPCCHEHADDHD
jgi:copper chaperone NosL